jgi:AraC-like DNA-binding protein
VLQPRSSSSGFHAGWHEHNFFEIGFVLDGSCTWKLRGKGSKHLSEGQCILLSPGLSHRETTSEPARLGWIGFDSTGEISDKMLNRPVALGSAMFDASYLLQRIYEEQHSRQPGSSEICTLALRHLLVLFERAAQSPLRRRVSSPLGARQIQVAQSLAAYLDQNISQPLSLEQVAEYHHLSASHLSLLFQKHYRVTPTAYRLQKRIARARSLLRETPQSVKEIATACGFTDAAHFCKEFKKRTGHTPGEMRSKVS